jgi:uncharacterized damage-inducible protein DinB
MREVERIVQQMTKMFDGEAWHGPSVQEVLAGVDASSASMHPIPGAHSIWELANHLVYTQYVILQRLQGKSLPNSEEAFFPQVSDFSPQAWKETLDRLKTQELELRSAILKYSEEKLSDPLIAGGDTAYNTFHGHVQHHAYHSGQIRLLRKALLESKPSIP